MKKDKRSHLKFSVSNSGFHFWGFLEKTYERILFKIPEIHPIQLLKRWMGMATRAKSHETELFLKLAEKFVRDDYMDKNETKIFKVLCEKGIAEPEYITQTSKIILKYWKEVIKREKSKNPQKIWHDISDNFCKRMKIPEVEIEFLNVFIKKDIFTHHANSGEEKIHLHFGDLHHLGHIMSILSHELVHYYEFVRFVQQPSTSVYSKLFNINRLHFIPSKNILTDDGNNSAHRWQPKEILAHMIGDSVLDMATEEISVNGLVAQQNLDLFEVLSEMKQRTHNISEQKKILEEKIAKK